MSTCGICLPLIPTIIRVVLVEYGMPLSCYTNRRLWVNRVQSGLTLVTIASLLIQVVLHDNMPALMSKYKSELAEFLFCPWRG